MKISFTVLAKDETIPEEDKLHKEDRFRAYLRINDRWNDHLFYTSYFLYAPDLKGEQHQIGIVKIGKKGQTEKQRHEIVPVNFVTLGEDYFSLGNNFSYYVDLNRIRDDIRDGILNGLRDVVYAPNLFNKFKEEKVTTESLMRCTNTLNKIPPETVQGQFARIVNGRECLSKYHFTYTLPRDEGINETEATLKLEFKVEPGSLPPTNVHALIGHNGVGKSHILKSMISCLIENGPDIKDLEFNRKWGENTKLFDKLISITFSAFDTFEPLPSSEDTQNSTDRLPYTYIGPKKESEKEPGVFLDKSADDLTDEFVGSYSSLLKEKAHRSQWRQWRQALETFKKSDPVFQSPDFVSLAIEDDPFPFGGSTHKELQEKARDLFNKLSTGQKFALLTITRLVELTEERTLLLIDAPESQLSSPLLSAFIRAISDLLKIRDGVAIIATRSPVILREIPQSCVWKIYHDGPLVKAEQLEIETFGENAGVLARAVFGSEATHSGYHQILKDAVDACSDFSEVLDKFDKKLGGEARAVARSILADRHAAEKTVLPAKEEFHLSKDEEKSDSPLNQILYGPPGTGKTYHAINEALKILDPDLKINEITREDLKKRFSDLAQEGRVRFVTFHQSFSYEDFVEGLRAETTEEGRLNYFIEDGIFKQICLEALASHFPDVRQNPRLWQISIKDEATHKYCLKKSEVRIDWSEFGDLRHLPEGHNAFYLAPDDRKTLSAFSSEIAKGDILVCTGSASKTISVGVVTGEYWHDQNPPSDIDKDYVNVLPVRWISKNLGTSVLPLNKNAPFEQATIHELTHVAWKDILIELELKLDGRIPNPQPYVLIIDEINRGNISRIFGELITLIEDSKRAGNDEALSVLLPYSKRRFSVPNNVYLIGTMNTADRSLVGLDIALRRRFSMTEMPSKPEKLEDIIIDELNVGKMLKAKNARIEVLLDRDRCIGHTYFLPLRGVDEENKKSQLASIFRHQIMPLLQEYFFEDWERIRLVLNDQTKDKAIQFIQEVSEAGQPLFSANVQNIPQQKRWKLNDAAFNNIESYKGIIS